MSALERISTVAARGVPAAARSLREVEPQRGLALERPGAAPPADFARTLSQVLSEVNDLQLRSNATLESFAAGEIQDLHEVVIAQQEAAIAFQLVQQVRDKLLGAYQELMRMQV
jgi:flagellar hook-basal body complex protein FliE